DAALFVHAGLVEDLGQARIHGPGHRVLLLRAIELDPQNAAGTLSDDVAHGSLHSLSAWLPLGRSRPFLRDRNGAARNQADNLVGIEAQFLEHLVIVLAEVGSAPGRHLADAVHLDWTADG